MQKYLPRRMWTRRRAYCRIKRRKPCRGGRLISLRWAVNRLRRMSTGEILWRAQKAAKARLEKSGVGLASVAKPAPAVPTAPIAPHTWGRPWLAGLDQAAGRDALGVAAINPLPYRRAADRVLAGQFDVFALHGVPLGFPPRWNRDPKTGTEAALVFGKTLNYRDPTLVGDI